jgi:hypothetical protein
MDWNSEGEKLCPVGPARIRQAKSVGEQCRLMRKAGCVLMILWVAAAARAEPFLPTEDGITWQYELLEEQGGPAASPPTTTAVTMRIGRETFAGKEFIKLATATDDVVTKTELMTLDEHGWVCHFRGGKDGRMAKLDPPQTIVPATIKTGDSWDSDGEVAGMEIRQHFVVETEESITVAAGTFRAFKIHCEDSSVMSVKLDRWFVPGTGFVKETTVVRGPTGGLLQRATLNLQKRPEVVAKPVVTPTAIPAPSATPTAPMRGPAVETDPAKAGKKLTVEVSTDPAGGSKSEFQTDAPNIYVRWHGHGLPENAAVRVAWIAEDVGDLVEPNFVIDETESVAPTSDASARFTLGRPPDGWAEGKYRVEFYVNDELEETVKVTIVK